MTRKNGPETRSKEPGKTDSFVRPGFDQKISRVRAIIDHRNIDYNPKTRVFALVELITENPKTIPKTDVLVSSGLLRFMPDAKGTQSVREWITERQTTIKTLATQNPRDYKTNAYDLFEETRGYGESVFLAESSHLMSGFFSEPCIREADIAIRLMYREAQGQLQNEQAMAARAAQEAQELATLAVMQTLGDLHRSYRRL